MRYFAPLVGLLLFSAAAVSQPATAQPNRAREGVQAGEVRSLNDILSGIRRERPGSLADVEGPNFGPYGEPHYRLKWLTPDGRVLWLDTDARTGRVLGVQGDDRGPARGSAPGAAPNRGDPRDPRAAQGQRRNLNPPPGSDYDFGAPGIRPPRGGVPNRRNVPEQNFAPGQPPPGYYGPPPPDYRRGPPPNVRRGPPPGYEGPRRGAPRPQSFEPPQDQRSAPPQQRFDRGGFDRGAPTSPRAGFRNGGSFGGGATERQGRMPSGEPRGRRSFR